MTIIQKGSVVEEVKSGVRIPPDHLGHHVARAKFKHQFAGKMPESAFIWSVEDIGLASNSSAMTTAVS